MPDADRPPRRWWRTILSGAGTGLILALTLEFINVLAGPNTHEVIPGLVYRTSQPCGARLDYLIRTHGIRTIVNFRGVCEEVAWYRDECRVAAKYGVSLEDFNGCSSGRLPSVYHVREIVRILDQSEYPILFHCNRGIDRTGLASALTLLLKTDTSLDVAERQLGFRHGHLPWGRPGHIDRFFVLYREWLAATKQTHARDVFRRWATTEYTAGDGSAEITLLGVTTRGTRGEERMAVAEEQVAQPDRLLHAVPGLHPLCPNVVAPEDEDSEPLILPRRTPCGVRVCCRNTSVKPWQLRSALNAGVHAIFAIDNERGKSVVVGRAGLFDATVPPGESIELTLAIPALEAGRYLLRVDMTNEQHALFLQVGSRQLFVNLEVR